MTGRDSISVNALADKLVDRLKKDAGILRLELQTLPNGSVIVDAGVSAQGGIAAGLRITEICMAGLGQVNVVSHSNTPEWSWSIQVSTSQPVLACLASQYAGWSLSVEHNDKRYSAMASGPGRALANKETLFEELAYNDSHNTATLILESDKLPPVELAEKVAKDCGVNPHNVTLIVTPTGSLAGSTQIAGRIVEVALHKAHELAFPLDNIVDALGVTPMAPPAKDALTAMGRTNDSILFGGQVQLFVNASDADAESFAMALPSSQSTDYGKPFGQVFKDYDYDFFKIDGRLFSPALIAVTALESGNTFKSGSLAPELLERSFGRSDP